MRLRVRPRGPGRRDRDSRSSRLPSEDQDEGKEAEEDGEGDLVQGGRTPSAGEDRDSAFGGEAPDGFAFAGKGDLPAAQGTALPGVLIQLEDAGDTLFASHRGFLLSKGMQALIFALDGEWRGLRNPTSGDGVRETRGRLNY